MRGLLFEGLDVSAQPGQKRPWVALVSVALHATAFGLVVLLPLLSSSDIPVVAWTPRVPDYVPDPPKVTLTAQPRPAARSAQPSRAADTAPAPTQSIQVPIVTPDHLPTVDSPAVDDATPLVTTGGCPECLPVPAGTPTSGGDPVGTGDGGGTPRLVQVGGDIQAPRKLKHVAPAFPAIALTAHVGATVVVECVIGVDGRVTSARVLHGHPLFDAASLAAVEQWVYEPTRLNGIPVAVEMTVTLRFVAR